ncbi:acetyl-CoA carboxylase carboxyl transferase subunit alpha [Lactiplantibacillus paraplantarum]|uniref:acetyl-CoA carboxylase carboxyltransferase subunit alpha n=1 Tax=Lactiplantibacillus paraplantarum TaxID=60520 RepID=UPI0005141C8A|nr:carboxyltransferase subunit alpha [Lactiplantibacillus paraplantarum]OAX74550.1 acetyl-CoA carboxylase carboxyl transferase subunit alpha [Lactiplantibacillus plantarum]ALO04112.1 acetyl-CoA carboxylase carboxyl transferase subunit alpha [Lactiplantibacillus paraplantarum]KGE74504.1 acetyl-CoA carboxylase [Lactiplantibacillus paraplantarum]MCT4457683.1 acetyl-CoA carboxylase carboxyl transferase subunit alpha [Lactiplantibacillus paraplantarum]MCW1910213.1 acetyl-CoA carboxylase carboxyl tr
MSKTTAYEQVQAARAVNKISIQMLIDGLTEDFFDCHGDRQRADDPAVIAGLATIADRPVTIIGIQKGQTLAENQARHFGCATPSGYRKALRLMQQAEQLRQPVVTLINTPGAYPGVDAEYQGQGRAIADCLLAGLQLKVPFLSLIVGEGGSGGALALACGDQVWMLANSTYSVLSPEGYATILWKQSQRAAEAAEKMRLTPTELLADGVIDRIIPEVATAADCQPLKAAIDEALTALTAKPVTELVAQRQARYRQF